MADGLLLRDVHLAPSPAFWPPAPGWWLVAFVATASIASMLWIARRRKQRRAAAVRLFDDELAIASTPATRLARASELLRRAARRLRGDADRLDGDDWLDFLDTPATPFRGGAGRLVLDGAFRRSVDEADAARAIDLARRRFVQLMEQRR